LKRDRLLSATVWLAALVAGALYGGAALLHPTPAGAQGTAQPVSVEMDENGNQWYFTPNQIAVSAGTARFTFHNAGTRRHNFVVEALNLRIPDLDAGATAEASFTFANPGTYDFICDLPTHAARGMTGKLVVAPAGAAPAVPAAPAAQATGTTGTQGAQPAGQQTPAGAQTTRPAQATAGTTGAPGTTGSAAGATVLGAPATGMPLFVSLAIHIPAAISWLGVVLYQAVVGAVPFLTTAQRADLLQRPRWLILAAIPLFVITGTYQAIHNPFVTLTDFQTAEAFRATSAYAQALFYKHGFVLLSMALTLAVTFWLAPLLARSATTESLAGSGDKAPEGAGALGAIGTAGASRLPLVAWANVAACLALLLCVAVMVFQLH
jgi:plastocyanin